MNFWPLAIIGGAVLFVKAYQTKQLIDQLQYSFVGIDLVKKGSGVFSTALDLSLELINPSPGEITVTTLSGSVWFGDSQVATFYRLQNFTIPSKYDGGKVTVHCDAVLDNIQTITTLISMVTSMKIPPIKMVLTTGAFNASITTDVPLANGVNLKIKSI